MLKTDVIEYFQTATATALAIGVSKATVSLWKEVIPWKYALLIQEVTHGALKYRPELYQDNNQTPDHQ
jgi:hypothetical protein